MKQPNPIRASGVPHANMHCGLAQDANNPNRHTLEGMSILIMAQDKRAASHILLKTLRQMHIDKSRLWAYADWINEPIEVACGSEIVLVEFRKDEGNDDGTVRLTHSKNCFHLSLPNVASWPDCGLDWVYSHTRCWKEKQNLTPWYGRKCDCQVIAPKVPPKRIPQWK